MILKSKRSLRRYRPILWKPLALYSVLALAVLLPLLRPGYILTLDMVFTPKLRMPTSVTSSYLLRAGLHWLNFVLPSQIIEKLLLYLILLLAGVGMYFLILALRPEHHRKDTTAGAYFAGMLYMFNPFVYDRFMAGQYSLLIGYALLPFFARALWRLLTKPSRRRLLWVTLWAIAVSVASIHTILPAMLVAIGMLALVLYRARSDHQYQLRVAKYIITALLLTGLASSYWLIPLLLGHSSTALTIGGFGESDRLAFATVPGHLGVLGNVIAMQGFWGETKNLYILPQDIYSWWLLPIIGLWTLLIGGFWYGWRRHRGLVILFGTLIVGAVLLAVGTASGLIAPLNRLLVHYVPLFSGYREPQKFVALIVFSYCYFGCLGIEAIQQKLRGFLQLTLLTTAFIIPILCSPLMLWGFAEQLRPVEYPTGWTSTNTQLDSDKTNFQTLFLPWHLYMPFNFTGRVIANPAPQFFDVPIISSQNPEIGGAHGFYSNPVTQSVEQQILPNAKSDPLLARNLVTIHVKYIIVAKDFDYRSYGYLNDKNGIRLILSNKDMLLYEVMGGEK